MRWKIERSGVRHFPAEERDAFPAVIGNDQPLFAISHAKRKGVPALVDKLHPKEMRTKSRPVLKRLRAHTDIAETDDGHVFSISILRREARILYHLGRFHKFSYANLESAGLVRQDIETQFFQPGPIDNFGVLLQPQLFVSMKIFSVPSQCDAVDDSFFDTLCYKQRIASAMQMVMI